MAQGGAGTVRGARAVGDHSPCRGARARAHEVRPRLLLGRHGQSRAGRATLRIETVCGGRRADRVGQGFRGRRAADGQGGQGGRGHAERRAGRAGCQGDRGGDLAGGVGGNEAVSASSGGAVHHLHSTAGGLAQAPPLGARHDAGGAVAVRKRLYHLHANRFDEPVYRGDLGGAAPGSGAVRRGLPAGQTPALHLEGEGCARGT